MKKKLLSIVLVAAMAITCLAGCGGKETKPEGSAPSENKTNGAAMDMSEIKIGEIESYVLEDGGWCQATHAGIVKAMENCGIPAENLHTLENIAEDQASVQAAAEELIDEGCNIIIGASTGYSSYLAEMAADYPEVTFAQWGTEQEGLVAYELRSYEAMFVAGYVCELMSQDENTQLGFSASMDEFSVRTAINAYALGAKYANPKATVKVACADSWYDVDKETQCAQSLIDAGIKYMGMECTSPAVAQTCEKNGAYCVGYHVDKQKDAPDAVLFSFVWNFAPIFEKIFTDKANGAELKSLYYEGGECAQLTEFSDLVPEDIAKKGEELKEKVANGEVNVYAGSLKDTNGNELVKEGEVMDDKTILLQEFFVENVDCAWAK